MDRSAFHPSTRLDRSLQLNEQAGSSKANKRRTVGETRRGRSAATESVNDTRGMCEGNSHRVTAGRRDGDRSRDQMSQSERNASTLSGEDSLANTSCSLYTVHQRWEMMMAAQTELIEDLERLSTNQTCKSIKSSFTSSEEFRTVMDDLYGTKDGKFDLTSSQKQNVSQPNSASNKLTTAVKTIGIVKNLEETNKHRSLPTIRNFKVENARRRWGKIRSHVREMAPKRRIGKATLNWAMLRHMVKGMTNPDRARQDLYIRYGLVPIILNDGRTIKKNIMLSNRLQVEMYCVDFIPETKISLNEHVSD
ncbi:hypothetical protein Btru_040750 [Bulinus truncatus]|nr:hypothetical protein Btru_040750 [Bulinus truncatus]